jgi:hypothetical protein
MPAEPGPAGDVAGPPLTNRRPSLHPTVVALAVVSMLHDLAGDMVTPLSGTWWQVLAIRFGAASAKGSAQTRCAPSHCSIASDRLGPGP